MGGASLTGRIIGLAKDVTSYIAHMHLVILPRLYLALIEAEEVLDPPKIRVRPEPLSHS